jgi:hypothetical protein
LPLPGLKQALLLATTQDIERTQEEISFIIAERRQQIDAARAASLQIAIRDLEERQELHEIATHHNGLPISCHKKLVSSILVG